MRASAPAACMRRGFRSLHSKELHVRGWMKRLRRNPRRDRADTARADDDDSEGNPPKKSRVEIAPASAAPPVCPITLHPIETPHVLRGVAFERDALIRWIEVRGMAVHPTTRAELDVSDVVALARAADRETHSFVQVAWSARASDDFGLDHDEQLRSYLVHTLMQLTEEEKFGEAAVVLLQMHQYDAALAEEGLARLDVLARRELGDERVQ